MAATTPDQLFERESYSPVPSTPASPSVRSGGTRTPGGSGSLFDRYASASPASRGSAQTYTSRLRSTGIKLACYLNTECNRGMGCIVSLPEACDTIAEVFPLLQRRMQLDSRMLYAAELFLPDGAKITSFKQLRQAAAIDTAIIVGCGEPFDPTTVPLSMLSFHMKGGGRAAPKVVKKELAEKKFRGAQLKADQVRASGHGLSSAAAQAARANLLETNREAAASQRHDYMEQLHTRAARQEELIQHVQANNARQKAERLARKAKKNEWSADRLQSLGSGGGAGHTIYEKHELAERAALKRAERAKQVRQARNEGVSRGKLAMKEYRMAAGHERRSSHIERSIAQAELDETMLRSRQAVQAERKSSPKPKRAWSGGAKATGGA